MKPTVPCRHCGKPIREHADGHRHVETGKAWCPPVTKAEPTRKDRA